MYCKNCGKELKMEERFCSSCGTLNERNIGSGKKRTFIKPVIGLLILFICVCGSVVFVNIIRKGFYNQTGVKEEVKKAGLFSKKKYLARVKNSNDLWGYINEDGEEVIDCQFDWAGDFDEEGVAQVGQIFAVYEDYTEYLYGIINTDGELILNYTYTEIGDFAENGLAYVGKNSGLDEEGNDVCRYGFINREGKEVIPCRYRDCEEFSNGYAAVEDTAGDWGYLDKNGNEVIECQYQYAEDFSEKGLAVVGTRRQETLCINTEGETILSSEGPEYFVSTYDNGMILAMEENDDWFWSQYYLVDENGEKVFDNVFGYVDEFVNGYAAVQEWTEEGDGKWSYINENGELLTQYQFSSVNDFSEDGYAIVMQESSDDEWKYGVIDSSDKMVIPCKYDALWYVGNDLFICARNKDYEEYYYVALIDKNENYIIPFYEGDIIGQGDNGWFAVERYVSDTIDDDYYDYESMDPTVYKCEYVDQKGDTVLVLPEEYVQAFEFEKVR